jgi:PAS domain S-box-containing protein
MSDHETTLSARTLAALPEAILNTAVDGVIVSDAQGRILMFNPACEALFGRSAAEVVGRNIRTLMPEPYRHEHDGYMSRYLSTGERRIIGIGREVTGMHADGSTFPMHLSVGEARLDEGRVFVGIIHDLTEAKKAESLLVQAQKMEAVGQIAGGIAHDFNNLLTVIIGNAELLQETEISPEREPLVEAISAAALRGAELTARLLAFGRKQLLHPKDLDVNALVRTMHMMLRRTLRADITLTLSLEDDLPRAVADAGQLDSALLNLALNAQDALPRGGSITISTASVALDARYHEAHPEVRPGHYVAIAMTDDGEGMTPAVRDRVFEPFFTTKEVGKGSGLGLSMVYGFVKQSNGHVTIYSEPQLGTTVRMYLPCAAGQPVAEPAQEAPMAHRRGAETVMVVEDDVFVRSYAVTCLTRLGYRVLEAGSGPDALKLLESGAEPDLLFTDIVMPGGLNGWDLARRVKALRPQVRVLFTSGYALEALMARGRLDPDDAIINKPYRRAELAAHLTALLGEGGR